jgi:DNA-binding transcriptional LysR family regulator
MAMPADLNAVTIFVKVVQAGSFIGASRALGIPKATISRKLAQLETSLSARLLQRTTRRVNLTEVGRLYFERCVRILDDFDAANDLVAEQQAVPHGTLRLSASVVFGVTILHRWLAAFLALYPTLQVDVVVTNRYVDMVDRGMDAAIRLGTPDSSLVSHPLGAIPYWVCASPAYLAAHAAPAHPQDLLAHDGLSVVAEDLAEILPWSLRRGREIVEIKVPNRLRTNDFLLIRQLLLAGSGIAFAPGPLVKEDVQSGRLVRLLPDWTLPERELFMVYPSDRHPSPKLRAWVEFVEQQIAGEPLR